MKSLTTHRGFASLGASDGEYEILATTEKHQQNQPDTAAVNHNLNPGPDQTKFINRISAREV